MKPLITDPVTAANHPTKYLGILGMLWITFLTLTMFTAIKTFAIGPFVFAVAILAYPFTYIFADIFTEVYGYRVTRKIVWTGFACLTIASCLGYIYTIIPSSPSFTLQHEFETIFRLGPIITFAFIAGFFVGELANSFFLAKVKIATNGKRQWFRLIGSTFVGQIADNTIAFTLIFTLAGVYAANEVISLIISSVIFCTVWEILALPLTYKVIQWIKKAEGLDTYDRGTIFNPFALK